MAVTVAITVAAGGVETAGAVSNLPPHFLKVGSNLAAHFLLDSAHEPVHAGRVVLVYVPAGFRRWAPN